MCIDSWLHSKTTIIDLFLPKTRQNREFVEYLLKLNTVMVNVMFKIIISCFTLEYIHFFTIALTEFVLCRFTLFLRWNWLLRVQDLKKVENSHLQLSYKQCLVSGFTRVRINWTWKVKKIHVYIGLKYEGWRQSVVFHFVHAYVNLPVMPCCHHRNIVYYNHLVIKTRLDTNSKQLQRW